VDGWRVVGALAPRLPGALATVLGSAVLLYLIVTGDYRVVWSAMASGVDALSEWTGLYDALTRVAAP
jgi:hypothetical protein